MSKKEIKMHQKGVSNRLYQAGRMESAMKRSGSKNIRKPKQGK